MGDAGLWATAELFENTLLGVLGPQGWQELFGGQMMFDDPRVKEAARLYGRMLDYQNADHSALSWDQAVRRVIHGKAAFTAMGDWAYSELVKAGLKGNQDFGWVSFPGTEDTFLVVADGFALAKDAPNIAEAVAWLEMVGSKRGAGSLQCSERFHPSAHRRRQGQIGHLSAVVDGVVSARRIVGELRAWRSGAGHLSARIERCDQYVCGRQERGAVYGGACAGGRSVRFVKIGAWETISHFGSLKNVASRFIPGIAGIPSTTYGRGCYCRI